MRRSIIRTPIAFVSVAGYCFTNLLLPASAIAWQVHAVWYSGKAAAYSPNQLLTERGSYPSPPQESSETVA
jgi:hypothetical protein